MTVRLNPYLTFDGQARDAMTFYADVLGGTLTLNTFAEYGETGPGSDGIMHALLETEDGLTLMASDTPPGMSRQVGDDVAISLSSDDADGGDRLRQAWARLSEGGDVTMPLAQQVWGDEFGMCTDRFGVRWMVNVAASTED